MIKLNGHPVNAEISQGTNISNPSTFLFAVLFDGIDAKVGDVIEHHAYGRRRIIQVAASRGGDSYILSQDTID